jgi:hypothetical protein
MNCKPGDLAFRVRAPEGAQIKVGAIVRCVEFDARTYRSLIGLTGLCREIRGGWLVQYNGTGIGLHGAPLLVPDEELRPICGDGLTDDVPAEVNKPQPVEV